MLGASRSDGSGYAARRERPAKKNCRERVELEEALAVLDIG
jgi:hypothetical protein